MVRLALLDFCDRCLANPELPDAIKLLTHIRESAMLARVRRVLVRMRDLFAHLNLISRLAQFRRIVTPHWSQVSERQRPRLSTVQSLVRAGNGRTRWLR